ncbi:sensor histidine kinase [Paenibacillus macerans]|uniref:sensor histidine kinase n=1 Tax=Paenibacillus macerans TaxID=44252 RepID=UPI003D32178F
MRRLENWFMGLKITPKIMVYYSITILIFMILSFVVYKQINSSVIMQKVGQMSMETVQKVDANLHIIIDTANNQQKILLSSQVVQSALSRPRKDYDLALQRQVEEFLGESMNFNEVISSIYVFDNEGNRYYVDNVSNKAMTLDKMKSAPWFGQLTKLNGGYLLKMNGGGTFETPGTNYISMIRLVNNIETQQPIGYMMINISENYINQYLNKESGNSNTQYILEDESNNNFIHSSLAQDERFTAVIDTLLDTPGRSVINKIDDRQYILSNLQTEFGWKIVAVSPFNELTSQDKTYSIIFFITLLANGLLLLLGIIFTSLLISKPIQKLVNAMKTVERGVFKEVSIKTGNDEIGKLKNVYNMMIRQIQQLFDNIIQEQASIRKLEMEALMNQVKPHFLYNTFDAISSLALSGNNQDVYTIVKALGKFYRSFLNNGKEEITIREELDIVDQYLTIVKYRYGDKFSVSIDSDERTLDYKIPRLALQPLVENAVNHGIRAKKGPGTITIQAVYTDQSVQLVVADDGVGMDEDKLLQIKHGLSKGVGLKTTIDRLNLFYNSNSIFHIESKQGEGTIIRLAIPLSNNKTDLP